MYDGGGNIAIVHESATSWSSGTAPAPPPQVNIIKWPKSSIYLNYRFFPPYFFFIYCVVASLHSAIGSLRSFSSFARSIDSEFTLHVCVFYFFSILVRPYIESEWLVNVHGANGNSLWAAPSTEDKNEKSGLTFRRKKRETFSKRASLQHQRCDELQLNPFATS